MDGQKDEWMMVGWMHRQKDGWMEGNKKGKMNGRMDIDGQIGG